MKFRHKRLDHTVTVKAGSAEATRLGRLATWEQVTDTGTAAKKATARRPRAKRTPAVPAAAEAPAPDA